jgi:PadR family transcriptional regulator AphA
VNRKVYHVTDEGRAELRRWLTTPLAPPQIRHPWLLQVFFSHQLSDEDIRQASPLTDDAAGLSRHRGAD